MDKSKAGQGANPVAGYKYNEMSNLVTTADRRFVSRPRGEENAGDPESLAHRIRKEDMGSRIRRDNAPTQIPEHLQAARKRKRAQPLQQSRQAGVISQADLNIEDLTYRPKTPATKETYDLITTQVAQKVGGEWGLQTIASATDEILENVMNRQLSDNAKLEAVNDTLGITLTSKEFNQLVNLSKKLTDYWDDDEEEEEEVAKPLPDEEVGKPEDPTAVEGIAVDFGDDDDGHLDDENQTFEVRDSDADSDDDPDESREPAEETEFVPPQERPEGEADEIVIQRKRDKQGGEQGADPTVIPVEDIDTYWLQREVGKIHEDMVTRVQIAQRALSILGDPDESGKARELRDVENDLMELFDFEHQELVTKLVRNRDKVVWVTRWRQAADDETQREAVEAQMASEGNMDILKKLKGGEKKQDQLRRPTRSEPMDVDMDAPAAKEVKSKRSDFVTGLLPSKNLNLEDLKFDQGGHTMTNQSVRLPHGSTKQAHKGYEEIHVPPPKRQADPSAKPLIPTTDLPSWAQPGFGSNASLNRIQTECYSSAFEGDGNMLICAPTGSGKTNVAMLAMLREIGKHRNPQTGEIDLDAFKIIYVAPLKALVAEQTGNFGKRLEPYGIRVSELTGDRQLTKQAITETNVIVTTPEKYDVITRKATETSYINLVRLICIDEIHLLHDDRGPVLENIVSRTMRRTEDTGDPVRIVGLSATLPNYSDVANFLRVPEGNTYHFDSTFRPCPLRQEFIGLTDKKAIKQLKMMNEICYKKVLEQVGKNKQQILVFVHSRKDTGKTARFIADTALERGEMGSLLRGDSGTAQILKEEANSAADSDLKAVMPYGIGIHHAGMNRADRQSVEDLFTDGACQILICTATLAWGVNLPAHTVIIKGTQTYNPERGAWVELSPQDTLQMLGRAGRPQFDTYGEGIIITKQSELQYYLSLMNMQLPIESHFVDKMVDSLNAEIVLGNIRTRDEGAKWLGYTYLFVRMLRSPQIYQVGADFDEDDALMQRRVDLIHSAASVLEKAECIKYDKKTGKFTSLDLGRIASHYYLTYSSMKTFKAHIGPHVQWFEILRAFSLSDEFKYIPVRSDEKLELAKLKEKVPVPVKEGIDEPACKMNVLFQCEISNFEFEGFALGADQMYITQSAGRIMRALFEIALSMHYSQTARYALELCKAIDKKMWPTWTPLDQFPSLGEEVRYKADALGIPWKHWLDYDEARIGQLLGMPKEAKKVHDCISKFPRLRLAAEPLPITNSLLRVELTITPDFVWDDKIHGNAQSFWLFCEDCDGERLLYCDQFVLRKEYAIAENNEHNLDFTVMVDEPHPPVYFISLISDRWMNAQYKIPMMLRKVKLPEKFPAPTPLLDLQPVTPDTLGKQELVKLYPDWQKFNRIQTQTFKTLYDTDDSVLIGSATGSGKTVCAEFALFRHFYNGASDSKAVYIDYYQEQVDARFAFWQPRLKALAGGKTISKLSGDAPADLRVLAESDLVLGTPAQWDILSRQWQRRKPVQDVSLIIADDMHLLGGTGGFVYEALLSRTQSIAAQLEKKIRIVGLSVCLSNAKDMGAWIGAGRHGIFNFSPSVRPIPLNLHLQDYKIPHFPSLMLAMVKPAMAAIMQYSPEKPVMIFSPSRKQVRATAVDFLTLLSSEGDEDRFLRSMSPILQKSLEKVDERSLHDALVHGIAYFHEALSESDKRIAQTFFANGAARVMIVSRESIWEVKPNAHLVIVMGTQFFDGREHRYIDYPIADVLQMFGKAGRLMVDTDCRGVLMLPDMKKAYYKKFLVEALPVESQLMPYLPDIFTTEIATKTIESTQDAVDWSTYTYFYRRLLANPSFYGLKDTSMNGVNAFLSDHVENSLQNLAQAKMIEIDEEEDSIVALDSAQIASYYDLSFVTMQTLLMSLKRGTKLKAMLEIVTAAVEFENLQMRRHEERILSRIYDRCPVKIANVDFESPHFKAFVLLQAHFSRMRLPADLAKDQEEILRKVLNLLSASVDILSSEGHMNALYAMEITQMVVQAMWDKDSPLKQLPYFDEELVGVCKEFGINDVNELIDAMDPEENKDYNKLTTALNLSNAELTEIAEFANSHYPSVDMHFSLKDQLVTGETGTLNVTLERDIESEDEVKPYVHAPFYPANKQEMYWVVVVDEQRKSLLGIKRVRLVKKNSFKVGVTVVHPGKTELTVFLMCDSYIGLDQEPKLEVDVEQGADSDEEGDEADGDVEMTG
ncbi:hypothetical protein MBLNU230_g4675t1 [Neophaeotheca triangularis]